MTSCSWGRIERAAAAAATMSYRLSQPGPIGNGRAQTLFAGSDRRKFFLDAQFLLLEPLDDRLVGGRAVHFLVDLAFQTLVLGEECCLVRRIHMICSFPCDHIAAGGAIDSVAEAPQRHCLSNHNRRKST